MRQDEVQPVLSQFQMSTSVRWLRKRGTAWASGLPADALRLLGHLGYQALPTPPERYTRPLNQH